MFIRAVNFAFIYLLLQLFSEFIYTSFFYTYFCYTYFHNHYFTLTFVILFLFVIHFLNYHYIIIFYTYFCSTISRQRRSTSACHPCVKHTFLNFDLRNVCLLWHADVVPPLISRYPFLNYHYIIIIIQSLIPYYNTPSKLPLHHCSSCTSSHPTWFVVINKYYSLW